MNIPDWLALALGLSTVSGLWVCWRLHGRERDDTATCWPPADRGD